MEFQVKHLGPIREATINLDRPLTVFCGANGTGKTYLSFIIAMLTNRDLLEFDSVQIPTPPFTESSLILSIEIDVDLVCRLRQNFATRIKSNLNTIFGVSGEDTQRLFSQFEVDFIATSEQTRKQIESLSFHYLSGFVEVTKKEMSLNLSLNIRTNISLGLKPMVKDYLVPEIYRNIILYPITQSIILPTERNTTNIFNKELSLSRNELIDQMQQESDPEKLVSLLNQKSKRYPLAITQNLKLANDWNTVKKTKGFYFDLGQEIESQLLDGTLSISSDGEVQFQPHKAPSLQLPIHITASIVKTLSSLILVIKHTLKENELIIIDEPEMNLHPDSQIVFAQLLAKLLNNGIRVLLSTHSDYIIRELNNMIMHDAVIQRGMNVPNYNKARLSKDHIGVYYFAYEGDEVEVNELTVRETGFEVPSIDQVVEQQNREADELFDKLYYTDDE